MARTITINDIDGNTWHTVDCGLESDVRGCYASDHPVQSLITEAIENGEAQGTYEIDGEEYTTRVIASEDAEESLSALDADEEKCEYAGSDAFNTGFEAASQGEPQSANPYAQGTWDSEAWMAGWYAQ